MDVDVFGQQPAMMGVFTQLTYAFSARSDERLERAPAVLKAGLERLGAAFPWTAAQVVIADDDARTIQLEPLPGERAPLLVIEDLRSGELMPAMDDLVRREFPVSVLDEDLLAPRRTVTLTPSSGPTRVCIVQGTLVRGGLLLTIEACHSCMDMTGLSELVKLVSRACRGEMATLSRDELDVLTYPQPGLVPVDSAPEASAELKTRFVVPPPETAPTPPGPARWTNFHISAARASALKASISDSLAPGSFISTDDALCALVVRSVARARLARFDTPGSVRSTFARAVDARPALGVNRRYPGMVQNMVFSDWASLDELAGASLPAIATQLRSQLTGERSTLERDTRALAAHLARISAAERAAFSYVASVRPDTGLSLSSWLKADCMLAHDRSALDFGLGLGDALAVRRPRFLPVEGLAYLLPRRDQQVDDVVLTICLRHDDLGRLATDVDFSKYARLVG